MNVVKINGKSYFVKFGLSALKVALKKYGLKTINDTQVLVEKLEVDYLPEFLKLGIDNGAKINGTETIDLATINEAFENDMSLMTKALEIFADDLSGEDEKEEGKKDKALAYKE